MVISTGSFRQMLSNLSLFFAVKAMWMNAKASERDSHELLVARVSYVVLLCKTLYSQGASFHPRCRNGVLANFFPGDNPAMD